jgi:hypothetical protein
MVVFQHAIDFSIRAKYAGALRVHVMPSEFIDHAAPSLQGKLPKLAAELPHGLIAPPVRVRELIELERTKHPAELFASNEEGLLNDWTLQYYFDYLGYEVVYRPTPQGPEVVAVGDEERLILRRKIGEDEYRKFAIWMP